MTKNTISCPNCGQVIDIDEIFYHQIEEKFKKEQQLERAKFQNELNEARKKYKSHLDELSKKEAMLKEQEAQFNIKLQEQLEQKAIEQKKELAATLKKQIESEQKSAIEAMQSELKAKSAQLQELNATKIEVEKLKREKEEVALKAKMEAELELNKKLTLEKEKMQKMLDEMTQHKLKEIQETQELKLKEKDEQLEQLKRSLEDAKRKAEQSSMQVQGEALELAIESWLASQFPFDSIEEVKKGAFGADCIQSVHTRELQNCGIICYESKNTKAWSDAWIDKLKQDMLKVNADIGVLVTSVYPKDMDRMGFYKGIWVCSLEEFKGSVSLLRDSLIRVSQSIKKEDNKADKMSLLYNYLTGNEFQMQLKAIVDGFMAMQTELDKERRSLMASWKRRQKLIDSVLLNTTEMYGALQGIAGSGTLGHIPALEMPDEEDD